MRMIAINLGIFLLLQSLIKAIESKVLFGTLILLMQNLKYGLFSGELRGDFFIRKTPPLTSHLCGKFFIKFSSK